MGDRKCQGFLLQVASMADVSGRAERRPEGLLVGFFKRNWLMVLFSGCIAGGVGVAASALSALVGPVINLILNPGPPVPLPELFGPTLSSLLGRLGVPATVSAGPLLQALPGLLVAVSLVKSVLMSVQLCLWEYFGERQALRLRGELMSGYVRSGLPLMRDEASLRIEHDLSSIIANDTRMAKDYIYNVFGVFPLELLQAGWLAATAWLLSPQLFLIFMLGILPAGAVIGIIGRKLRRRSRAALDVFSDLVEWLQGRLLGIETILHFGTEKHEAAKMRHLTAQIQNRFYKLASVRARTSPLVETMVMAAFAVVIFLASRAIGADGTSAALLLSFISSLSFLGQSLSNLGRAWSFRSEGAAAADRIAMAFSTLHAHQLGPIAEARVQSAVRCRLQDVSLTYAGASEPALADFSYEFRSGRAYCVLGESGSGKSTLLGILLGLLEPSCGRIERSGAEAEVPVTYLPQRPLLAPATVRENLVYPLSFSAPGERLDQVLERVGLKERLARLPAGLETTLGFDGAEISGGEAQRIHVARALHHASPLVVIDEGTSALDPEIEHEVLRALRELASAGCCVILVAHRLAALNFVDEALLLAKGRLVAAGEPAAVQAGEAFRNFSAAPQASKG